MSGPFPPDILSYLFTLCIPSTAISRGLVNYQDWHNRRPLLHLASVCREWREVACTTSELWTTCWLSYSHPEFNVLWLSRTGSRLFDIIGLPAPSMSSGRVVDQAVSTISPFMKRCRTLSISYETDDQDASIAEFLAPNLISCEIKGMRVPSWFYNSLSHSSRLQKLDVNNYSPLLIPVFASLSSLYIARSKRGIPLQLILTNAQKLHTLQLSECYIWESMQTVRAIPVVNKTLTKLHLWFDRENNVRPIFEQMTLPSLKILDLCGRVLDKWGEEDTLRFHAFLERSRCRLESFMTSSMDSLWLIGLLRHDLMSSLGTLEASHLDIKPEFISFLIDTTNLPNLRILKLLYAEIRELEHCSPLADMVSARRAPIGGQDRPTGSRLEYLQLGLEDLFMGGNPQLRSLYAPQVRRIKAIASASELGGDVLTVRLQEWRPGRMSEGSDEETDALTRRASQ